MSHLKRDSGETRRAYTQAAVTYGGVSVVIGGAMQLAFSGGQIGVMTLEFIASATFIGALGGLIIHAIAEFIE